VANTAVTARDHTPSAETPTPLPSLHISQSKPYGMKHFNTSAIIQSFKMSWYLAETRTTFSQNNFDTSEIVCLLFHTSDAFVLLPRVSVSRHLGPSTQRTLGLTNSFGSQTVVVLLGSRLLSTPISATPRSSPGFPVKQLRSCSRAG
jgi:hypothetical protein